MRFYPVDHGAFWWVGGLFGLLIVVAIVVGVILVVREVLQRQAQRPAPPQSTFVTRAIEELDLRYARGELDRAEWVQRRADLLQGPTLPPPPPATPPPPGAPPPGPPPA